MCCAHKTLFSFAILTIVTQILSMRGDLKKQNREYVAIYKVSSFKMSQKTYNGRFFRICYAEQVKEIFYCILLRLNRRESQ